MNQFAMAFTPDKLEEAWHVFLTEFPLGLWETVYVTVLSTLFAIVIGLPLGILLVTGDENGIRPMPKPLMKVINVIINFLRSVPFLILIVMVIPLTRAIIGTSIGSVASIVPLVVAAFPFVARLVESSLRELDPKQAGGSFFELGSYVLLPIIRLLGTEVEDIQFFSKMENGIDIFTKGILRFSKATGSFKVGLGVKTEGNLVISGTKGYAYVPAPWWKTDFFELRYENQNNNKKYFYSWNGEGLRYEIQEFMACIYNHRLKTARLRHSESVFMAHAMQQFKAGSNVNII